MLYLEIPYVPENNRVNKNTVQTEIQVLNLSEKSKNDVLTAIYHQHPAGVNFEDTELKEVSRLAEILGNLGIPYRQSKKTEY